MQNRQQNLVSLLLLGALALQQQTVIAAGDQVTEQEFNAKIFARNGQRAKSLNAISKAVELAKQQNYSPARITRLKLRQTCMMFENGELDQGLHYASELLRHKEDLRREINQEPEIQVELDELRLSLSYHFNKWKNPEGLELAVDLTQSFPQFTPDVRSAAEAELFSWHFAHRQYAVAESLAKKGWTERPAGDRVGRAGWTARLRMTLEKEHKTAEAKAMYERMCREASGHPRNSCGWHIHMALRAYDAGDYELAMMHANKAVATRGPDVKGGSFAISEAFGGRAQIELAIGKYAEAERDARTALTGSVGAASEESRGNFRCLTEALRAQGKTAELARVQRDRDEANQRSNAALMGP